MEFVQQSCKSLLLELTRFLCSNNGWKTGLRKNKLPMNKSYLTPLDFTLLTHIWTKMSSLKQKKTNHKVWRESNLSSRTNWIFYSINRQGWPRAKTTSKSPRNGPESLLNEGVKCLPLTRDWNLKIYRELIHSRRPMKKRRPPQRSRLTLYLFRHIWALGLRQ